jgi:hypothetical protein
MEMKWFTELRPMITVPHTLTLYVCSAFMHVHREPVGLFQDESAHDSSVTEGDENNACYPACQVRVVRAYNHARTFSFHYCAESRITRHDSNTQAVITYEPADRGDFRKASDGNMMYCLSASKQWSPLPCNQSKVSLGF